MTTLLDDASMLIWRVYACCHYLPAYLMGEIMIFAARERNVSFCGRHVAANGDQGRDESFLLGQHRIAASKGLVL